MAFRYWSPDRDQLFLLPVSMRDWLDQGHLAWFVIDVVAALDTSVLHARHRNDGPGRPAYDPEMMLGLVVYAYCLGVRSSRRIEALCRTDAAFKVLAGGATPDHATLARFLVDHEGAMEGLFVDVLRLCGLAGLVSVGVVAIDGTKMGTNAALDANRSQAAISAELGRVVAAMVAEGKATDAAEDTQAGLFGGDRLPVELASRAGRRARLEAALAIVEAEQAQDAATAGARSSKVAAEAAAGRKLTGRKAKDPRVRADQADADIQATQARLARLVAGRAARRAALEAKAAAAGRKPKGPKPITGLRPGEQRQLDQAALTAAARRAAAGIAPSTQARVVNVTDPDSRIMKTAAGWIQGYNCQAAVDANQIVVGCAVTQQGNDIAQYQPMVSATQATLSAAGILEELGVVVADAGYWSENNATAEGPERFIATLKDWKQRKAAQQLGTTTGPPPAGSSPLEAMEHRLRTPQGAQTYARRSQLVEPVFGDHKHNRGFRHFRRRGLKAATSEWALINLAHDLAKLFDYHTKNPGLSLN